MKTRTVAAVIALGAAAPLAAQSEVPLIPRDVLFANPDHARPKLSPDGKKLSFLATVNGVLNVFVGPFNDPKAAKAITNDGGAGIRVYEWAGSGEHILYLRDVDGDGAWRLFCTNLTT